MRTSPAAARRRIVRSIRLCLLVLLASALWLGLRDLRIVKLPGEGSPLAAYGPGVHLLVVALDADEPVRRGDVVVAVRDGQTIVGVVAALPGEPLAADRERGLVGAASEGPTYPAPRALLESLPPRSPAFLVASEEPLLRAWTGFYARAALRGRVVGALPW